MEKFKRKINHKKLKVMTQNTKGNLQTDISLTI